MFSRHLPLHAGQDPRAWSEYTQLRDELSKLTHPARPDVDWQNVEQLCVTLFRHNGSDLQTAAWFCCARLQRSGFTGLHSGRCQNPLSLTPGIINKFSSGLF
ncbi:type VI secretion system ImpA family N-terminal domain-containing protein [Serratia liquefaciens]|uniref:type VI secretion system ImpA family N-terminal domain-containing protein n=1 Tax=Serratia TaxID=613 RepID=UPI002179E048|nr:Uncharacterized protein conserved in bacteria [Serratia quinivorans]CAI1084712.1 Uncharacterized protein conserved in bacteria [Serratia quinivorans]CAI2122716.1 Uncharacterized protein conserved in bacteria [Serratia quinivorans]CAI2489833.1 Uncharacterized protein conserved in bacteria [Serratia liquefaciens]